jgi:lipoprotein-releasing system ATP-binding protein
MAILEAQGIERTLGAVDNATRILQGIDLSAERGQFVSLCGASGSGKSTLLYLLGILDKPTAGEVRLDGQPTSRLDDDARAELRNRKLGFVFQFHFLLPEFSALENVILPILRRGTMSRSDAEEHGYEVLRMLHLEELYYRKPGQLSGGQQQRVSIARAVANDPALILADEPTGNLDSKNAEGVFEVFQELVLEHGRTVIMVTHDTGFARRATRQIRLLDGRIVEDTRQRAVA